MQQLPLGPVPLNFIPEVDRIAVSLGLHNYTADMPTGRTVIDNEIHFAAEKAVNQVFLRF